MSKAALAHLEGSWDHWLRRLSDLVRIGGVSANPSPDPELGRSAQALAALLREVGFEHVDVLEQPGGHPFVVGDWLHAPGAPTVLIYGHHDVMPPGRPEKWISPPFEPEVRDGRLYGRGSVDDKAGVISHVAACAAWLAGEGRIPLNIKLIFEGEEESGSPSLEPFLEAHRERIAADVIVLTDTANYDVGIPAITVSLRGLVGLGVEYQSIDHPVHSGMWGGPVPDPVMGLCRAIAGLTDARGRLVPSIAAGVRPLSRSERAALDALPFSEQTFRDQVGMEPGVELVGDPEMPVWGRVWRQPAVTVIAFEARPIAGSTNQIIESARARISVRTVPDMDPVAVQDALVRHFDDHAPFGLRARVTREAIGNWWMTDAQGPAFDATARALEKGYGRRPERIGCGGSIPFVEPFAKVLGGAPAILMGVEDPICNAHGENESLHLEDFRRATRAALFLYEELAHMSAAGAPPAR